MAWYRDPINLARVAQQLLDADVPAREIVRMLWKPTLYAAEWDHVNGGCDHDHEKCLLCQADAVDVTAAAADGPATKVIDCRPEQVQP